MSICVLCGKEGKIATSHILPLSFYNKIKEGGDTKEVKIYRIDGTNDNKAKGIRAKLGICTKCDSDVLGKYDEYGLNFMYADFSRYNKTIREFEYQDIPGDEYDYDLLKKFLVSVLWRASLSERNIFGNVNLGQKYNDLCIRYINGEVSDIKEINIILVKMKTRLRISPENLNVVTEFQTSRNSFGQREYKATFGRYKVIFTLCNENRKECDECFYLKPSGFMCINMDFEDITDLSKIVQNQIAVRSKQA